MKKIARLTLSVVLFLLAIIFTIKSAAPYESNILFFSILLILLGGIIISFTISVWSKHERKKVFSKSLEYSIGLSSLIFILGYLYTALQPIILK